MIRRRTWILVSRAWILTRATSLRLAQWKEHQTWDLAVTGSNPVPTPETVVTRRRTTLCGEAEGGRADL